MRAEADVLESLLGIVERILGALVVESDALTEAVIVTARFRRRFLAGGLAVRLLRGIELRQLAQRGGGFIEFARLRSLLCLALQVFLASRKSRRGE